MQQKLNKLKSSEHYDFEHKHKDFGKQNACPNSYLILFVPSIKGFITLLKRRKATE